MKTVFQAINHGLCICFLVACHFNETDKEMGILTNFAKNKIKDENTSQRYQW